MVVTGKTATTGEIITFFSGPSLLADADPVNKIFTAQAPFTALEIIHYGGGLTGLMFEVVGSTPGQITLRAESDSGGSLTGTFSSAAGSNPFTAYATGGDIIIDFAISSADPWSYVHQIQVGVVQGPPVPEPSSLLLLGTGLVGIVRVARRRRQ